MLERLMKDKVRLAMILLLVVLAVVTWNRVMAAAEARGQLELLQEQNEVLRDQVVADSAEVARIAAVADSQQARAERGDSLLAERDARLAAERRERERLAQELRDMEAGLVEDIAVSGVEFRSELPESLREEFDRREAVWESRVSLKDRMLASERERALQAESRADGNRAWGEQWRLTAVARAQENTALRGQVRSLQSVIANLEQQVDASERARKGWFTLNLKNNMIWAAGGFVAGTLLAR